MSSEDGQQSCVDIIWVKDEDPACGCIFYVGNIELDKERQQKASLLF